MNCLVFPGEGHLNSFSASGGGNFNKNFPKIQMPGGCLGGMLKLRFDWYIRTVAWLSSHDFQYNTILSRFLATERCIILVH